VSETDDDDARGTALPTAPPEPPAPRTAALLAGAIGVLALAAALGVYLVGGRPYGQNVGGGILYVLGLAAALTASVLLWMAWSPVPPGSAPRPLGLAGTTLALLLTSASGVVSLSHVAGGAVELGLMGATAAVLAIAVALRAAAP
jgi:hypothetical protein